MADTARSGDTASGTCSMHQSPQAYNAVFVAGAPTVLTNGMATVRKDDIAIASCGHPVRATTFSGSVYAEGLEVHRVGDDVENSAGDVGTTDVGSSDVQTGD